MYWAEIVHFPVNLQVNKPKRTKEFYTISVNFMNITHMYEYGRINANPIILKQIILHSYNVLAYRTGIIYN
jgi:hypothetical protein